MRKDKFMSQLNFFHSYGGAESIAGEQQGSFHSTIYHRDYLTQRRKHSNKGKTVMKSQGRKYTRTVVMVVTMDKKVPRGKR